MDDLDFHGSTSSQSVACESTTARSLSSGSSIFNAIRNSPTREKALPPSGQQHAPSKLSSSHNSKEEEQLNGRSGRHVRFSLSTETQDSSNNSQQGSSIRHVVKRSLLVSDAKNLASSTSSSNTTSSSSSNSSSVVVRKVGLLRRKNRTPLSSLSSQNKNSLSIKPHDTAAINNNSDTTDNASTGSNNTSKSSSVATNTTSQRRRGRRLNYSSNRTTNNNNNNIARKINPALLKPSLKNDQDDEDTTNASILPEESRPVRGAGSNVLAIQDAGTQQMLTDECAYLCSSILSSSFWSGDARVSPTILDRRLKSLETAICDLVLLLSTNKTRCSLWMDGRSTNAVVMLNILNVLDSINSPQVESLPGLSRILPLSLPEEEPASTMNMHAADSQETAATVSDAEKTNVAADNSSKSVVIPDSLKSIMAALLHFVSWDCTMSDHSAARWKYGRRNTLSVAIIAQRIRQLLLQHKPAMQAVGRFIVDDPVTRRILQPRITELPNVEDIMLEPTSQESFMSDISAGASQESFTPSSNDPILLQEDTNSNTLNDIVSVDSNSSQVSITSGDPTAIGRRRRKRKRLLRTEVSELDFIVEERHEDGKSVGGGGDSDALSPPRKRPYGDGREGSNNSPGNLSFTSRDSLKQSSNTQTVQGDAGEEEEDGDGVASTTSTASSTDNQLIEKRDKIWSKLILLDHVVDEEANQRSLACPFCNDLEVEMLKKPLKAISSCIALHALNRMVSGKEGEDESCLDQEVPDAPQNQSSTEDDEEAINPLLVTNRLLGESGVLPFLGRGLAESFQAVTFFLQQSLHRDSICPICLAHLHERVSVLEALIDGACCLNDVNRRSFCASPQPGLLIGSLVWLLHSLSNVRESDRWDSLSDTEKLSVSDILLAAARILTSLTHENELAAQQLMMENRVSLPPSENDDNDPEIVICGLDILCRLCHSAVKWRARQTTDKHVYDVITFCLNTLSNVMDFENVRGCLFDLHLTETALEIPNFFPSVRFVSWLAQWLVSETEPFRDVIMQGTFGASVAKSTANRDLLKEEEESLVVAGHGMVVLACAMTTDRIDRNDEFLLGRVRELICEEMPLKKDTASSSNLLLIKNTLKAFCNIYRFSIGELSVAVVEPVRLLLAKLDMVEKVPRALHGSVEYSGALH